MVAVYTASSALTADSLSCYTYTGSDDVPGSLGATQDFFAPAMAAEGGCNCASNLAVSLFPILVEFMAGLT
jgi:hypothetical protein